MRGDFFVHRARAAGALERWPCNPRHSLMRRRVSRRLLCCSHEGADDLSLGTNGPSLRHLRCGRMSKCFICGQRVGGRGRVRTGDPLLAKQVLSQLSYTPTRETTFILKHFRARRIFVHALRLPGDGSAALVEHTIVSSLIPDLAHGAKLPLPPAFLVPEGAPFLCGTTGARCAACSAAACASWPRAFASTLGLPSCAPAA